LQNILAITPVVEYFPARAGDVRDSLAAIESARTLLGYTPRVSVAEGLKKTVDFFKKRSGPES